MSEPTTEQWLAWAREARAREQAAHRAYVAATAEYERTRHEWQRAHQEKEYCAVRLAHALRDEGIPSSDKSVGVLWRPSFAEDEP
jgi:hypothetical protein